MQSPNLIADSFKKELEQEHHFPRRTLCSSWSILLALCRLLSVKLVLRRQFLQRLAETSFWHSETTQWKCHCVSHLHLHLCVLMMSFWCVCGGVGGGLMPPSELVCGIEQILWVRSLYISKDSLHSVRCAWRCCIISVFMFNIIIFHSGRLQVVSSLYNLLNPVNKSLLTKHTEDLRHSMEFLWVKKNTGTVLWWHYMI